MGSKRIVDFDSLLVDQSMGATFQSPSTNILYTDRVGYQISFTTSDAIGTFSVEVSNDESVWVALTLSTPITAASANDDAFIDVETAAKFVRLVYTRSSGTGTLQAHMTAKSISG
jgi:hypothetical protein